MAKEKAKAKAKSKAKSDSKEKKAKGKGEKELTPIQKAQLARAANKGKKGKAKAKKKGLPVFKAPEGFKPFFMKVSVMVDKDGLISDMRATRVKGGIGNIDDEKKIVDMMKWDQDTIRRLLARYTAVAFVRNEAKRLPQGTATMIMRVSANRDTGALKVAIKDIKFKEGKDGKSKALDKKDPKYRLLRKPARFLPAAFTKVKDFPSAAEMKAMNKEEESADEEVLTKKSTGKKVKVDKKAKAKPEKKAKKADKKDKKKDSAGKKPKSKKEAKPEKKAKKGKKSKK